MSLAPLQCLLRTSRDRWLSLQDRGVGDFRPPLEERLVLAEPHDGQPAALLLGVFIYWGWESAVNLNEETEGEVTRPLAGLDLWLPCGPCFQSLLLAVLSPRPPHRRWESRA